MEQFKSSTPKIDFPEKIRGEAKFTDDFELPGMLYAETVRSTIAKGKIKEIKLPEIPEGYYWISAKDIPGENVVNIIFSDWPIFADKEVHFIG